MGGGGFKNVPSTFWNNHLTVSYTFGDCFVKRKGRKAPLTKLAGAVTGYLVNGKKSSSWRKVEEIRSEGLILEGGDSIVTGRNGHVVGLSCVMPSESVPPSITVFPDSEVVLRVKTASRNEKIANPDGSTAVKSTTFNVITGFELLKGLFQVSITTTGNVEDALSIPSKYPAIEFKPMMGKFGKEKRINTIIELNPDNTLTIFGGMMTVVHKVSGVEAKGLDPLRPVGSPKITVTRNAIYITDMSKVPDRRAETITKKIMELYKHQSSSLIEREFNERTSKESLNKRQEERIRQIKQEITNEECKNKPDEKVLAFLKNQLGKAPSILISNEDKNLQKKMVAQIKPDMNILESLLPEYTPVSESDRVVAKDVKRTGRSYEQIITEHAEKEREISDTLEKMNKNSADLSYYKRMLNSGKSIPTEMLELINRQKANKAALEKNVQELGSNKGIMAQTVSKKIDESVTYNKVEMHFTKVEKGTELNMSAAPAGKEYLMIYFDSTNKGVGQAFFYPGEEARLVVEGEIIPLRNYRMETNKDPGKLYKDEQFFFVVPETAKEFILEIGKKTLPKQTIKIKL